MAAGWRWKDVQIQRKRHLCGWACALLRCGCRAVFRTAWNAVCTGWNDYLDLVVERINSDSANVLGNLVNRTISMQNKYFNGWFPIRWSRRISIRSWLLLLWIRRSVWKENGNPACRRSDWWNLYPAEALQQVYWWNDAMGAWQGWSEEGSSGNCSV